MKYMRLNKCVISFLFVSCLAFATCYPTGSADPADELELRDEKKYVNGTVVGTYTYKDKEGNPIHVKYYADDSNYGVELKSYKIISSTGKPAPAGFKEFKPMKVLEIEPDTKMFPDISVPPAPIQSDNPMDDAASSRYKGEKSNSDFETYYQNDVIGPNKCGKAKVRVYYDKERRIREVLDNEADKYCEPF